MLSLLEKHGAWVISESENYLFYDRDATRKYFYDQAIDRSLLLKSLVPDVYHPRRVTIIEREQQGHGSLPLVRRWFHDEYIEGICLTEDLNDRKDEIAALFREATVLPDTGSEQPELDKKIYDALASLTVIDLENVPFSDAMEYLKDLHEIEIQIDALPVKCARELASYL